MVAGEGAGDAADEQVVGFASAGPQRDEDVDLPRELYALYVRRARWGTGLGHRLLQTVVGDDPCSLWVFRDNARARGFYARHGFQPGRRREGRAVLRRRRGPAGAAGRAAGYGRVMTTWLPGGADSTTRSRARAGWSSSSRAPLASERSAAVSDRAASSRASPRCRVATSSA